MSWFQKSSGEKEGEAIGEDGTLSLSEAEKTQREVFICTFSMLAKMASVDGVVTRVEASAVNKFMQNTLHLDEERRKFAISIFNRAKNSETSFESFAKRYKELLKDKPEMFEWMVDVLLRVSLADTVFTESEAEMMGKACEAFDVDARKYEKVLAKFSNKEEGLYYKTLESSRSDSMSDIEANYQRLLRQYDVKKMVASGMPEEFIALAEEKIEKIQQAFLVIKQEKELGA